MTKILDKHFANSITLSVVAKTFSEFLSSHKYYPKMEGFLYLKEVYDGIYIDIFLMKALLII